MSFEDATTNGIVHASSDRSQSEKKDMCLLKITYSKIRIRMDILIQYRESLCTNALDLFDAHKMHYIACIHEQTEFEQFQEFIRTLFPNSIEHCVLRTDLG